MTDINKNKEVVSKTGPGRVLVGIGAVAVVAGGAIYGIHYHRSKMEQAPMHVTGAVGLASVPGSGVTSAQYIRSQQKQNSNFCLVIHWFLINRAR